MGEGHQVLTLCPPPTCMVMLFDILPAVMIVCFLISMMPFCSTLKPGCHTECIIAVFVIDCCRADLQKQAELTPQRYKDRSTAYLAGRPPSTKNSLLPGDSLSKADQEDSD